MTGKTFTSFTYQLLISALVLTCWLGVHGGVVVLPLHAQLLDDGRAGHAEQPVDVDSHLHLHLGVVAVVLGTHVLNSETPLGTTETALIVPKCRGRGENPQTHSLSLKGVNLNSKFTVWKLSTELTILQCKLQADKLKAGSPIIISSLINLLYLYS